MSLHFDGDSNRCSVIRQAAAKESDPTNSWRKRDTQISIAGGDIYSGPIATRQ